MAPRPNSSRRSYRPALVRVVTYVLHAGISSLLKDLARPGPLELPTRNWRKSLCYPGSASAKAVLPPGETPAHRTAFYSNIAPRQGSVNAAEGQCSGIAMAAVSRVQCGNEHFADSVKDKERGPVPCVMA